MIIGILTIDIHFPYFHSLKEKRKSLNSLRDRIKQKYNVAFAELAYQDKWQRTMIGIITLNSQKKIVEQIIQKSLEDLESAIQGEIIDYEVRYL